MEDIMKNARQAAVDMVMTQIRTEWALVVQGIITTRMVLSRSAVETLLREVLDGIDKVDMEAPELRGD